MRLIPPPKGEGGFSRSEKPGGVGHGKRTRTPTAKDNDATRGEIVDPSPLMEKRGFHFRRQSPREGYIVDFVCMRERLVIEVDGGQHNEPSHQARNMRRDARLSRADFRVLRFWNNDIDRNLDGVLEMIDLELRRGRPHPAGGAGHPPPAGEG